MKFITSGDLTKKKVKCKVHQIFLFEMELSSKTDQPIVSVTKLVLCYFQQSPFNCIKMVSLID